MVESHRVTFWVVITRPDGKEITPYMSEELQNVISEASSWSRFFGLGAVSYTDAAGITHVAKFELGDYD